MEKLHTKNIEMIDACELIVSYLREQSYGQGMILLESFVRMLGEYITEYHASFEKSESATDIWRALNALLDAQGKDDRILIADVLQLQVLPFIKDIQIQILNAGWMIDFDCIYAHNYGIIQQKYPELCEKLEGVKAKWLTEALDGYEMEYTNCGRYTLRRRNATNSLYLHSNDNPGTEARGLVNRYYRPAAKTYVIFGLGLGYHCEELCNRDEGISVKIYERDIEILFFAMLVNKLDWLLRDNVTLVVDSTMQAFISQIADITYIGDTKEKIVMIHYPSTRFIEAEKVRNAVDNLIIMDNSIREQSSYMRAAFRENTKRVTLYADELAPKFQNKKAVVIAGGPSLDKNIQYLKNKRDDMVFVAVGTVFKKLIREGIALDYVVVADTHNTIGTQFEGCFEEEVPVLLLSTAYMGVAMKYKGKKYLVCQKDYDEAESFAGEHNLLLYQSGGSVSTLALDICLRLGCESVAFVGLDLSYTSNVTHASGTAFCDPIVTDGMQKVSGYVLNGDTIEYQPVSTTHLFNMYRNWIEQRIKNCPVLIYDCTEGGAVIKGTKIAALRSYLE